MKRIISVNSGVLSILLLYLFVFSLQICSADDDIHKDNIVVILDASGSMQDKFSGDPDEVEDGSSEGGTTRGPLKSSGRHTYRIIGV